VFCWSFGAVGDWAIGPVAILAVIVAVIGPLVLAFMHARLNAEELFEENSIRGDYPADCLNLRLQDLED